MSGDPEVVLSAILGSCIATCLWDSKAMVGGMNHILLPGRGDGGARENRYGVFAMEALINELMHQGARKANLSAKMFGGASTFQNAMRIGEANAEFVRHFLTLEGIPIEAESTGGTQARRVRFFPQSGRAKQMITTEEIQQAPKPYTANGGFPTKLAMPGKTSGKVELF